MTQSEQTKGQGRPKEWWAVEGGDHIVFPDRQYHEHAEDDCHTSALGKTGSWRKEKKYKELRASRRTLTQTVFPNLIDKQNCINTLIGFI